MNYNDGRWLLISHTVMKYDGWPWWCYEEAFIRSGNGRASKTARQKSTKRILCDLNVEQYGNITLASSGYVSNTIYKYRHNGHYLKPAHPLNFNSDEIETDKEGKKNVGIFATILLRQIHQSVTC